LEPQQKLNKKPNNTNWKTHCMRPGLLLKRELFLAASCLLRTLPALEKLQLEGDEKTGLNILKRAIEEPVRQIAENAGVDGAVVVQKVKRESGDFGFNAQTNGL